MGDKPDQKPAKCMFRRLFLFSYQLLSGELFIRCKQQQPLRWFVQSVNGMKTNGEIEFHIAHQQCGAESHLAA
jgi:hypothetical protein